MAMTTLPVIERELRTRARQGMTYWSRCAVAALATLVAVESEVISANAAGPNAAGPATLRALGWLGLLLAGVSGLVTADSISSERRQGTLGLLFLTDLKGRDVVFGKMVASGLAVFYALTGFVPGLALALLAGGVSGATLTRTALALLNACFVSLAIGLWVSARAESQRKAMRGTLVMTVLLFASPWFADLVSPVFTKGAALLVFLSPYSAYHLAPDMMYAGVGSQYWLSLGVSHVEAWVLLAAAAVHLRRNWRLVTQAKPVEKLTMEPLVVEEAQKLAASKTALLEEDPVCWAVSRLRGQSALIWVGTLLFLGGAGVSWISLVLAARAAPGAVGLWNSVGLFLSLGSAALLAWASGRFLFEMQRNGELELLLSTPLGAREIVGGQWRALVAPVRGAWMLVALLLVLQFALVPSARFGGNGLAHALDLFQRGMLPVNKALDVVAVCWVGMWFGLRARRPFAVMAWSGGLVIGLPWVATYLFEIGFSLLRGAPAGFLFWLVGGPLLILAKNVFFIRWAAQNLRAELRTVAPLGMEAWLR